MSRCSILFTLVLTGFRSIKFSRRTSFFFPLKLHQLFHIPVHERKRKKGEETESLLLFLEVCRRGWFHDSKCSCVRGGKSVGLEHVISLLHVAQFSRVLLCCACVKKKKTRVNFFVTEKRSEFLWLLKLVTTSKIWIWHHLSHFLFVHWKTKFVCTWIFFLTRDESTFYDVSFLISGLSTWDNLSVFCRVKLGN